MLRKKSRFSPKDPDKDRFVAGGMQAIFSMMMALIVTAFVLLTMVLLPLVDDSLFPFVAVKPGVAVTQQSVDIVGGYFTSQFITHKIMGIILVVFSLLVAMSIAQIPKNRYNADKLKTPLIVLLVTALYCVVFLLVYFLIHIWQSCISLVRISELVITS